MKRLQDIADQVGVSRTTVSNVLHGNTKKVSKEMIRKISEILNQEGYVPDTSSRELTRKGSCIIGLVLGYSCIHGIPSLRDTFVAEFLSGVEETAHRNGYYVMLIMARTKIRTGWQRLPPDGMWMVLSSWDWTKRNTRSCAGNSTNIWS